MNAVLGGMIIGLAVSAMLYFTGRVTGISGILGGIINPQTSDKSWRVYFISGLLIGGVILRVVHPQSFAITTSTHLYDYVIGGLLVGVGTLLGNGCTSGHGVCGISRMSMRSIIATMVFISFGIISVLIFKSIWGEV